MRIEDCVAVKELKLSYHNEETEETLLFPIYIYICTHITATYIKLLKNNREEAELLPTESCFEFCSAWAEDATHAV